MKKGNVNYAISGRVFYVNLCIDNVKNRILFFYPREFPGRPSGAYPEMSDISINDSLSEVKRKRSMYNMCV
jgi:hypothetical protein